MVQQLHHDPDIYQIQVDLPDNPLRYLNCYVIVGKTRNLVIDTGFNRPECHASLWQGLAELDIDLARTDLFLTHLHSDHTGLVGDFIKAGCTVYMGETDYNYVQESENGDNWRKMEQRFLAEGMPREAMEEQEHNQARLHRPDPDFKAVFIHDGEVLQLADEDFHVIHTPGHTKGLCCLYLPGPQVFFSSDHILFDITPNITIWNNMKQALRTYLDSLDKVRSLPVRLALPGHRKGAEAIDFRIDAIKAHHARRLAEVMAIAEAHPHSTAYELASHMTWSMRGKKWEDFPPTQKWFALGEALSHIEYLIDEGRLTPQDEMGKITYRVADDSQPVDFP